MLEKIRKYLPASFVILLFIIGMYLVPLRITGFDLSNMPGDPGDNRFNNYILEHGYRYLAGEDESFWTAPFMFPQENNIALSDNLSGTLPFYAFFRTFGAERETAFQLWFLLMFTLNYFVAFFSFRHLTRNSVVSALGAYIFAFSMPVIAQINHVQLLPRFAIPAGFVFLIIFFKNYSLRNFAGFLSMIICQFYCGMYLGFLFTLGAVVFFIWSFFFMVNFKAIREKNYKYFSGIILLTVLALIVLYPLAEPYMRVVEVSGYRDFDTEIMPGMPRAWSYFYSSNGSLLWDFLSDKGDYLPVSWEHRIFPGGVAWLCVIATPFLLYFRKRTENQVKTSNMMIVSLLTLFTLIFLTLFFKGDTWFKYILHLPGFGSMRVLTRIIFVLLFFFSLSVVFVAAEMGKKLSFFNMKSIIVVIASTALISADQYVSSAHLMKFSKSDAIKRVELVAEKIRKNKAEKYKAFAYMASDENTDFNLFQLDAMLASQDVSVPTVNGYAASAPGSFGLFWWKPNETHLGIWLKEKNFTDTTAILKIR